MPRTAPTKSKPKINIYSNERVLIVAAPNDGKTTLALKLLNILDDGQPLVVVNPGADETLYKVFGPARDSIDPNWPAVQHIAPPITDDPKKYTLWWQIAEHGKCRVYIDELDQVGTAQRYNVGLKYLYQRGRRRFINMIASTQRSVDIPKFAIQFSEHIFAGHVAGGDLERLEQLTKQPWGDMVQKRTQHQFAYWSKNEKQPPFFIN